MSADAGPAARDHGARTEHLAAPGRHPADEHTREADRPRVLCCGLATLDVVQRLERVPAADEKVVAEDLFVTAGGPAANAAVTAAALGASVRLVTRIGEGPVARLVHDDLRANGVDVLDLASPGEVPAVSTVLVTRATGERAVVSVNATRTDPATAPGLTREGLADLLVGVDAVLVDGHHLDLAVAVAAEARRRGVPVLLDGGSWKAGLEGLLPLVDVALLSSAFRLPVADGGPAGLRARPDHVPAGELFAAVRASGPPVVARSRGDRPLELLLDDRVVEIEAPQVTVRDTLGAGDVLHGALATWLAVHGAAATTVEALTFAARVASDACRFDGARGWLGDERLLAELRRRLTEA